MENPGGQQSPPAASAAGGRFLTISGGPHTHRRTPAGSAGETASFIQHALTVRNVDMLTK